MSYLSIGGITVPLDSVLSFSQTYEPIERSTIHRLGVSGRGVKQTLYAGKLRTTIQGSGWTAPGLSALDLSQTHVLLCAAPLSNGGGVGNIQIGDENRRRSDAGFEPVAYALFDDGQQKTPVTVDALGGCVITPVAGAVRYKVDWYPRLIVWVEPPQESVQTDSAQFLWNLVAEEE